MGRDDELSVEQVRNLLHLEPHPTCGFVAETYRSPQRIAPGGTFHTARLAAGGRWHWGASTEWPGVEPPDVEVAEVGKLGERFPALKDFL